MGASKRAGLSAGAIFRFTWALLTSFVMESIVFGLAVLPAAVFWEWHFRWEVSPSWLRVVVLSMSFIPAYILFALSLMVLSAVVTGMLGWRTPDNAELPIVQAGWPLLNWIRYGISNHLVRIFAGTLFRATPVWTMYMRLNGARLGRRVIVNSLDVTDHNLLDFGDDVVVGGGAHLAGHTVERGALVTASVRLGRSVIVGTNSVVEIGVEAGPGCHIGAMAFVPKNSRLDAKGTYVGIPAHKLERTENPEFRSPGGE